MNPNLLSIGIASIKPMVEKAEGGIKEKLKAAMIEAKDHWMVTNQDDRFRIAVGAVMDFYGKDSEEWRHIEWEIKKLAKFSAFITAAQSGLNVSLPDTEDEPEFKAIGIMGMWREINHV